MPVFVSSFMADAWGLLRFGHVGWHRQIPKASSSGNETEPAFGKRDAGWNTPSPLFAYECVLFSSVDLKGNLFPLFFSFFFKQGAYAAVGVKPRKKKQATCWVMPDC